MFRILDPFPSTDEGVGDTYPAGAITKSRPNMRTEKDPFAEKMCSSEYRTVDKVQKPSNSECYTPSSEPSRIDLNFNIFSDTSGETEENMQGK
jgi:hypothetical protein